MTLTSTLDLTAAVQVQRCTLLSIKTGGCPENCSYCSQSSAWRQETGLKAEKLLDLEEVFQAALRAKASGSTRFCMGAAWRGPSQARLIASTTCASQR
jgi:biotin synthase